MEIKTRNDIINEWESYRNKNINNYEDWSNEHDKYLAEQFISLNKIKNLIKGGYGLNVHQFRKYLLDELDK